MKGSKWEARIARENQELYDTGRAMLARVPTHYHSAPSRDPKVDFVGLIDGGRMVAIEAKMQSGALTRQQRAYLQTVARFGGLALVYRWIDDQRYLCAVDDAGNIEYKSGATLASAGNWLDEATSRGLI